MGNNCCGNRNKAPETTENFYDLNTTTSTKSPDGKKERETKAQRKGECPYCKTGIFIPFNLKYVECGNCKEKSMQDGCTNTLYK